MSEVVRGVIERIVSKPLQEEDKYGNKFRYGVKIGDDWYSLGSGKGETLTVQDGKDWVELTEGSEVKVKYEQNGDFRNSSRSNLTIIELAEKKEAPAKQEKPTPKEAAKDKPAAKPAASKGGYNSDENQKRITFGMCFNNACNQLGAGYTAEALKARVFELYQLAVEGSALAAGGDLSAWNIDVPKASPAKQDTKKEVKQEVKEEVKEEAKPAAKPRGRPAKVRVAAEAAPEPTSEPEVDYEPDDVPTDGDDQVFDDSDVPW